MRALHVACMAFVLAACGDDEKEVPPIELEPTSTPVEATPTRQGYEVDPSLRGGAIVAHVRWVGARPELPPIPVGQQHEVCGEAQPHAVFRVAESGAVADAVVSLSGIRRGKAMPTQAASLDQEGCRYVPHIVALPVGGQLRIENSDAVLHNVHATHGSRDWMNLGQPAAEPASTQTITQAGVSRLVCDAGHPWMLAWLHAFEHPYFAVTGEQGDVRLEDVPPGEHEIVLWHEGVKVVGTAAGRPVYDEPMVQRRPVTVVAGQDVEVSFELSLPAPEAAPLPASPQDDEPTPPEAAMP